MVQCAVTGGWVTLPKPAALPMSMFGLQQRQVPTNLLSITCSQCALPKDKWPVENSRQVGGAEAGDQLVTLHSTGNVERTLCPAAVLVCKLDAAGQIKICQTSTPALLNLRLVYSLIFFMLSIQVVVDAKQVRGVCRGQIHVPLFANCYQQQPAQFLKCRNCNQRRTERRP